MKAKIEKATPEGIFEPFALRIVVESVNEARALWHRLNVSSSQITEIAKEINSGNCIIPLDESVIRSWGALNDYMEEHNLKGE